MRKLRNALIGAMAVSLVAIFVPTAAWAYTALTPGSHLLQPYDDGDSAYPGTVKSIYNSSGQKIGEYELFVHYVMVGDKDFVAYANIRVKDTLIGNGRGVKVKLMTKTDANASNVIGTYKGGNNVWSTWAVDQRPTYSKSPVWGFDVDHGEDWSGVPFQYTGKFDRYVKQAETTKDNWPFFNVYP